jgi:hypothetical protein
VLRQVDGAGAVFIMIMALAVLLLSGRSAGVDEGLSLSPGPLAVLLIVAVAAPLPGAAEDDDEALLVSVVVDLLRRATTTRFFINNAMIARRRRDEHPMIVMHTHNVPGFPVK